MTAAILQVRLSNLPKVIKLVTNTGFESSSDSSLQCSATSLWERLGEKVAFELRLGTKSVKIIHMHCFS